MTTITIPRALLEQALANMVRAELLYGQLQRRADQPPVELHQGEH